MAMIDYQGKMWRESDTIPAGTDYLILEEVPPEPPDVVEAEALAEELYQKYMDDGGMSSVEDSCWKSEWLSIARYVLANYTPKKEGHHTSIYEDNAAWLRGYEAGEKSQQLELRRVAYEDGRKHGRDEVRNEKAAKPTISPENLDVLAAGLRIRCCTDDSWKLSWASIPELVKIPYRNQVLSMLNAEVAAPQVDFVVSGPDGAYLDVPNKKAAARYAGTVNDWPKKECWDRRDSINMFYEADYKILLDRDDKNGGAK